MPRSHLRYSSRYPGFEREEENPLDPIASGIRVLEVEGHRVGVVTDLALVSLGREGGGPVEGFSRDFFR